MNKKLAAVKEKLNKEADRLYYNEVIGEVIDSKYDCYDFRSGRNVTRSFPKCGKYYDSFDVRFFSDSEKIAGIIYMLEDAIKECNFRLNSLRMDAYGDDYAYEIAEETETLRYYESLKRILM